MENDDGNVREMTRAEKNFFNGVTIDVDSSDENFRTRKKNYEHKTRSTYFNVGGSSIFMRLVGGFLGTLLKGNRIAQIGAFLIGLAFAALMFFVALPILFMILAIGLALLAFSRISR